ncbi:MAG: hypothetical protein ACXW5W_00095 [Candidatus Binatia bacterium]
MLYLSKINDSQQQAWGRVIEGFDEKTQQRTQLALLPVEKGFVRGRPRGMESECVLRRWNCVGRTSTARAGWPVISMNNWPWFGSGKIVYPIVARALVASRPDDQSDNRLTYTDDSKPYVETFWL